MKWEDVASAVRARVMHRGAGFESDDLQHVVACDLMSDVLVADHHGHLLVTSLASDQAVRTADIVGAAGVLVVNGKPLPASMSRLAQELNLTLMQSAEPKFEACVALGRRMNP